MKDERIPQWRRWPHPSNNGDSPTTTHNSDPKPPHSRDSDQREEIHKDLIADLESPTHLFIFSGLKEFHQLLEIEISEYTSMFFEFGFSPPLQVGK
ncbi:hypothetical protein V6N11_018707 [Hibiscus sabdariffa]|uniref:Uncharacterized protein n=2 Tax=Hibiscus sabdariffa TaxID=183260 RepID=A0ABR1ZDN1_9ROSI